MMWFLALLVPLLSLAQELDLSAVQALEEKMPSYGIDRTVESDIYRARQERRFRPPRNIVKFEKIQKSGTSVGSVKIGVPIVRISDNQVFTLPRSIYLRYFQLQDEQGFKYLVNKDGSATYKINTDYVEPLKEELTLYEPPKYYSPAPVILRTEYDRKLVVLPEAVFYTGYISGSYMKDLFNDSEAQNGITNQYGLNLLAHWKVPIRGGIVLHYDRASYELNGSGKVMYSSFSFGPQFKTRDFEIGRFVVRAQTQYRYGPYAKASAQTVDGDVEFKFYSSDFLTSLEHPIKNRWGEFVLGAFFQAQWLSMKEQPEIVSLRASNEINKAYGVSFSQVFD